MHGSVASAVDAFEDVERARLLLAKKEASLTFWTLRMANDDTVTPADKAEYARLTEDLEYKYEEKHWKVKVGP